MSYSISDANMVEALVARRLLLAAERAEALRKGKTVEKKTAKDYMEEEQAILSGNSQKAGKVRAQRQTQDDVQIKLSDLKKCIKEVNSSSNNNTPTRQSTTVYATYRKEELDVELKYEFLEKIDGLVLKNKNLAETDRYRFEFQDGTTFKITDKWSGKSTTIWGDPHVDTSDEKGSMNGEFSDLKESNEYTTLMLQDGTRVTFTAKDNGVIEAVDIFKGSQHLNGIGSASQYWNETGGLFAKAVAEDAPTVQSQIPLGDVVYAGGDGNDWYNSAQQLVWGKTTGPIIDQRPQYLITCSIQHKITEVTVAGQINRQI
jgi:hypothetical protein